MVHNVDKRIHQLREEIREHDYLYCMLSQPKIGDRQYGELFAEDERLAGVLLDRLTHHVHSLEIVGDSYRLKSSLKKKHGKTRVDIIGRPALKGGEGGSC